MASDNGITNFNGSHIRTEANLDEVQGWIAENTDTRRNLNAAYLYAQRQLVEAKEREEREALEVRCSRIKALQNLQRRQLKKFDERLCTAFEHLGNAEVLAMQLHGEGAGAREMLVELNNRHGRIAQTYIMKFLDAVPNAETMLGSCVANNQHGREQFGERSLIEMLPDYAELFRKHHQAKMDERVEDENADF